MNWHCNFDVVIINFVPGLYQCSESYFSINPFTCNNNQVVTKNKRITRNKQHDRKEQLISFHLNGHTLGFYPQIQI